MILNPEPDMVWVRELDLYAENSRELYPQFKSIISNIMNRMAKGQYRPELAPKLWKYWYDEAARRYKKEFGAMAPVDVRREAARIRAQDEYEKIVAGEYGELPVFKTRDSMSLDDYQDRQPNPGIGYHREMRRHYNKMASRDMKAGHKGGSDYWLGAAAAENRAVAASMREGRFEKNPELTKKQAERAYRELYNRTYEAMGGAFDFPTLNQVIPGRAEALLELYEMAYGKTLHPGFKNVKRKPRRKKNPAAKGEWVLGWNDPKTEVYLYKVYKNYASGSKALDKLFAKGIEEADLYSKQYLGENLERYGWKGAREINPCGSKRKPRRKKNPCATSKRHKMFHDANPDRAYKVKVPKGFPRRMWMLGKLKGITTTDGRKLSGGYVAAGTGNTIYLLDVRRGGFTSGKVAVIEYDPVKPSRKAGPVYYHPYKTPPSIRRVAKGFYIIRGANQKITPRGITG